MIIHPYHVPWEGQHLHGPAHRAAMKRGAFYSGSGFIDVRTYTFDPWAIVRTTGVPYRTAMLSSMRLAVVTGLMAGTIGYMGLDPLNVTPGYGLSPGDRRDRFGREIDHKELKPRLLM